LLTIYSSDLSSRLPAAGKDIAWLIVAVVSTLVSAVISEVVSVVSEVVGAVSQVVGAVSQVVGAVSQVVVVVSQVVGVVSKAVGVVSQAVAAAAQNIVAAAVSVVGVEPMVMVHRAGGQLHSVLGLASVLGVSIRGHTLDASHAEPAVVSTTVGVKVAGLGPSHSQQSSHTELHDD
jgi:hypothetical protein